MVTEEKLVSVAARRYARRSWWVDIEDLKQEGRVAVEEARRKFDHNYGTPWEAYCWRAILFAMKRFLWASSVPVSGGSHRPRESYANVRRADAVEDDDFEVVDCAPDKALFDREWDARVRKRVMQLGGDTHGDIHLVLLEEVTARQLAARIKKDPKEVYARAAELRAAITQDRPLWELMRVRKE